MTKQRVELNNMWKLKLNERKQEKKNIVINCKEKQLDKITFIKKNQ